jgi:hypothetical protein
MPAPPSRTVARPFVELALHRPRVGQIGLQHDARFQLHELRFVEHRLERLAREMEVAVFLHVEVHELRPAHPTDWRWRRGKAGGVFPCHAGQRFLVADRWIWLKIAESFTDR